MSGRLGCCGAAKLQVLVMKLLVVIERCSQIASAAPLSSKSVGGGCGSVENRRNFINLTAHHNFVSRKGKSHFLL